MWSCLTDPVGCVSASLWAWALSVEWYWWALVGAVIVGWVWKRSGWPGIVALSGAVGFILGRRLDSSHEDDVFPDPDKRPSAYRKPKVAKKGKRPTIFDIGKSLSGK